MLRVYAQKYRIPMRILSSLMHYPYDGTDESVQAMAEELPMVAFTPKR